MLPEDREAADKTYDTALTVAMAEYDSMEDELNKMQTRASYLKRTIQGLAGLLGKGVNEKYTFRSIPQPTVPLNRHIKEGRNEVRR